MAGKRIVALGLFALVVLTIGLFAASGTEAGTYKPTNLYSYGTNTAGVASNNTVSVSIPAPDYNYEDSSMYNFGPIAGTPVQGKGFPIGAWVGTLSSTTTLGLLNSACNKPIGPTFDLFNASIDTSQTLTALEMAWTNTANPPGFAKGNAILPDFLEYYPTFLNTMLDPDGPCDPTVVLPTTVCDPGDPGSKLPLVPRARFAGHNLVSTSYMLIEVVILNPGQIAQLPSIKAQMIPGLGYAILTILNNPVDQIEAPGAVSDFCTSLTSVTTLYGTTKTGAYIANPPATQFGPYGVGYTTLTAACGPSAVAVTCNVVRSEGFIGLNNATVGPPSQEVASITGLPVGGTQITFASLANAHAIGDPITSSLTSQINPANNSGILATNTHLNRTYSQSERDFDGDGYENDMDPCFYISDAAGGWDPRIPAENSLGGACDNAVDDNFDALALVNDGCPAVGPPETGAQCLNAIDDDADGGDGAGPKGTNDGCPLAGDFDYDGLPDTCDPDPQGAGTGIAYNCPGPQDDCDWDLYNNQQDICPLVADGPSGQNQIDSDGLVENVDKGPKPDSIGNACDDSDNDGLENGGTVDPGTQDTGNCRDGNDNDGDTLPDMLDPQCLVWTDKGEITAGHTSAQIYGTNPGTGLYFHQMPWAPVCLGAGLDTDLDRYCDATETAFGTGLGSCATDTPACDTQGFVTGTLAANSKPESYVIDASITGVGLNVSPALTAPQSCSDGVDNDKDGATDAADLGCTCPTGTDADCDGVPDAAPDNCPLAGGWNPEQTNTDAALRAAGAKLMISPDTPLPLDAPLALGDVCDPDDDNDAWTDDVELYLGTDPLDNCPNFATTTPRTDAWPLDMDMNQQVSMVDVNKFAGKLGRHPAGDSTVPAPASYANARLDLDKNNLISMVDVNKFAGWLGKKCA